MTKYFIRQGAAPQVTMVNGEIVLDPSSLEYSAPSTPPHEIVEVVHEGNESLIDKSVRRTRKNVVKPWTQQEEELLYEVICVTKNEFNCILI